MVIIFLFLIGSVILIGGWLAWTTTFGGSYAYTDDSSAERWKTSHDRWAGDYSGGFVAGLWPLEVARVDARTRQWADEHGYDVVYRAYRSLWQGPFFWRSTDAQAVQYLTVRDRAGRERSGYIRTGHWFFGLHSADMDVEWEDAFPRERWRR